MASWKPVLRAGALLAMIALIAVGILELSHQLTRDRIAEAQRERERMALRMVLPSTYHDNDVLRDRIRLQAPRWLGSAEPLQVFRGRHGDAPSALVIQAVAPDGYSGAIRLLIGVDAQGRVLGVRVTDHQETPGLGDAIEAERGDWSQQFVARALGDPPAQRWKVRKDGGDFDQLAGATVTPRAVVAAVRRVLLMLERHQSRLYAAPSGSTMDLDDGPES